MNRILKIHPDDNIAVALQSLPQGTSLEVDGSALRLIEPIAQKHKFSLTDLHVGDDILMYGVLVGKAIKDIPRGGLISTSNIRHAAQGFAGRQHAYSWKAPDVQRWKDRTFMGYHRADGQVGTQNYWLILPLVFCENRNIQVIKDALQKELGYAEPEHYRALVRRMVTAYQQGEPAEHLAEVLARETADIPAPDRVFQHVDGIKVLTHEGGCGGTREDARNLCALLAGYCVNPNVAGITVLSLGCQHAQFDMLQEEIQRRSPKFSKPLLYFEQQAWGSERAMLSEALRQTFLGLAEADTLRRAPAPLSQLTMGVKCGGSDGFSGISANPAVGHCADLLVALGGKVVLAEFPELCGVEQQLIDRRVNDLLADRFSRLMREYARRAEAVGSGFDMNPSPGNIKDGLITDGIKSAGAARKGGTSPVCGVLGYPEYAKSSGLNLLCTPGNDVEATTGMAAAGCTVQLFTTGLGTPTGNPISPMVKISTNTELARRMPDIIDVDAGSIIRGEKTVEQVGEDLLDYVIELASGHIQTQAMRLGQDDFIPWKRGVSL